MPGEAMTINTAQSATVVTNTRVRPGHEAAFEAWQQRMNEVISGFNGFLSSEIIPPNPPLQPDWVIIQRFNQPEQLKAWLDSPERSEMIKQIEAHLVGEDDISVFVGKDAAPARRLEPVTAMIITRVRPGNEDAFQAWHQRIQDTQSKFPGYLGCQLQPPVEGFQEDWITLLRFDSAKHLDDWLHSEERARLVKQAENYIDRSRIRTVRTAFESWFDFGETGQAPPPSWKQAVIVEAVLFPVVMLQVLFLSPLVAWLNLALLMFINTAVSVSILTWPLVPYTSRAMRWWLTPEENAAGWHSWAGPLVLAGYFAVSLAVFWGLTNWVKITPITHF
jgi:antibiotic biosynthesis monooxygenase (ABM) superfamily enzyme